MLARKINLIPTEMAVPAGSLKFVKVLNKLSILGVISLILLTISAITLFVFYSIELKKVNSSVASLKNEISSLEKSRKDQGGLAELDLSSVNLIKTEQLLEQILPKTHTTEITLLKEDLINNLKLSTFFSDKFNKVTLTINPQKKICVISTKNIEIGETESNIDAMSSWEVGQSAFQPFIVSIDIFRRFLV